MKTLFLKFKNSLNAYLETKKWYQWGIKNEVEAHFYIIMGISLLTIILWPLIAVFTSILISLAITTPLAILAMAIREATNKSGWSWKDIYYGLMGLLTSFFIISIVTMIVFFIRSFGKQL